jgi:hypothetical protein
MIGLALQATLPIFLGVLLAGWLGRRRGAPALWAGLSATALIAVGVWGMPMSDAPLVQRYGAPLAVYVPPLLLAGVALSLLGRPRWTVAAVSLLAGAVAASNILLGQFFFVLGCAGNLWECP